MDPISKINRNAPITSQPEISTEQKTANNGSAEGIANTPDTVEPPKLDALRFAYLSGRSEGKVLMSEASFNHVLRNELTPKQYPEAFKDPKNWVQQNFALTPDQEETLNLLSEEQIQKVQNAAARAAELNLPLSFQIDDPAPSEPGPRNIKFGEPVVTAEAVNIRQECARLREINEQIAGKSFEP
jgi:hypothetical protein